MAEERDELLDHEYDGIREFDNPLPRWWMWLFYGTIIFSVVYFPYYLGWGPSSSQMYEEEMAAVKPAATTPGPQAGGGNSPAASAVVVDASVVGNPQAIEAGRGIYQLNCLPCHGDKGQGLIGPNLTDRYWLHGNQFADLVAVITNGVPDKGMIAWKSTLNPEKTGQVTAFILSLRGSNPPNAKAPQGQEYPQ